LETIEVYRAVCIQSRVKLVTKGADIKKNLNRAMDMIDFSSNISSSPSSEEDAFQGKAYAPVKVIAFPESFLQGFLNAKAFKNIDVKESIKRGIFIEIPGEETEILGRKAKEYRIYIQGVALEYDPHFPDMHFNSAFIIGPDGKVIHKYRKFTPAYHYTDTSASTHDVYDKYLEIYGKNKSVLETFFPVTDTPIGKLGTLICMDGHYPENFRALGIQGAEIIFRSSFVEPLISPPNNIWEIQNRHAAWANIAYIIAPDAGELEEGFHRPRSFNSGDSMIVDFEGRLLARTPYPGEAATSAPIYLDILRRRRADPGRNFLTQLRTEVYKEIYKEPIYPKNLYLNPEGRANSYWESYKRDVAHLGIIERFFQKGIYKKPKHMENKKK
jgi:predicted amidohydrolase